jgi:hypothetical protein
MVFALLLYVVSHVAHSITDARQETPYVTYDHLSRAFTGASAVHDSTIPLPTLNTEIADTASTENPATHAKATPSPTSSVPASSASDSDFVHVRHPNRQRQRGQNKSYAAAVKADNRHPKTTRPTKHRPAIDTFKVYDEEAMVIDETED